MLRPLTIALLLFISFTNINAQYVQTGLPLRDTTVAGVDLQAHDVSMSADGNTAVAGYPNSSYGRGGFAIYERNGNNWNEVFSYYNTSAERSMGMYTIISGDGNTVVVSGANGIYRIYIRQSNTWQLQHNGTATPAGIEPSISYNGNTMLLGNKVWVRNNNQWALEGTINQGNSNGFSGVLSADGNTAIVNRTISVRQGANWVQQGVQMVPHIALYPNVVINTYSFNILSGDGNTYVLGFSALSTDYLAVFKRTGNVWMQETLLYSSFSGGNDLSISYNGDKLLFVARSGGGFRTKAGKTYLRYWQRIQNTWSAPVVSYGDTLQGSYSPIVTMRAAMDSTGTQVLVANRFTDSFYGGLRYYTANGFSWQQQGTDIFNTQPKGFSWQGSNIVISHDGSTMAGAGVKDGYGAVWVYTRNGNKWLQQGQPVTCPEAPDRDRRFAEYGTKCIALSADGNTMAVTAIYDEVYISYQGQEPLSFGAVYMFNRTAGVWQFSQKITIPNDTTYKWLNGGIVKLSNDGKTLLASSTDRGAWIFTYTGGTWQLQQNLPNLPNADTYQADLSGDGNTAIMVQEVGSAAGRVYVYKRIGTTWQLQQGPILPPNTSQPQLFPVYTVLSNDGKCFGISDIYSSPDKIYLYKDSAGVWVRYGNTCDSTCGSSSINGSGAFCLSSTGDTVYSIVNTNSSSGSIGVDVYVKSGNKWVYVYRATPSENTLPNIAIGYSSLGATVAASGDLKHLALGYPYMDGASGGIYPFIGSSLNVTGTTTNAACPTIANGKVRINVSGGVAPVNITWSTGAVNVDSISNLAVGTYYITVTDGDNIEVVRQYVINATQTMQLQNVVTNYSCSGNTGNIAVSISGGAIPYSIVWSTSPVQTNDTAFNLTAGAYSFMVTDSVGCTYTDSAVLNPNVYWSSLTANQPDCTNNNGSAFMQVHGGTAPYTYNWSNGDTTATVNTLAPGTYYVTATDGNACTITDSLILTPFCVNILQGHLFFDDNNNCVQDSGELNATGYNLYADGLSYYTYGNTDAQGNYSIMVPTPGAFMVKIGNWSSCSFNVCTGGTYPLPVSFTGIGDTITGADLALVDTAYDLTILTSGDLFNPGFAGNVDIQYYNTSGNIVPGGSIDVTYDSLLTFNSAMPAHTTHNPATRTITFNVGNVGPADTSQHIKLNFTLAAGINVQNRVLINCNISPSQSDCNIDNNELEGWIRVAGAYDPNTKESSTDGRIGFADSAIDYTIHFQNTGNDTTHFVVVTDTLPDFLDPASVQTMSTSHTPYTFRLSGEGIVEWRFDPIYLPDSTTDEPNSHGYVTFRARITNSPPVNTRLENKAHIYFDYNEPIVTNTVTDTVVCIVNGATKQVSICTNQTYDFNGRLLTSTGTYKTAYRSRFNCDSIVTLVLSVNSSANPSLQLNTAICEGESYSFYGSNLLTSGTYTASLPASIGCDTIVTLNLLVHDTAGPVSSASICKGESYLFDGNNLTASGTYFKHLQGAGGCDSVITLQLQVLDTTASSMSSTICNGESYQFDGNSITTPGTYAMHLQNANGCDSTVVLTLSVNSLEVTATLNHDTLFATGGSNYTWINCTNGDIVSSENSFTPNYSGSYAAIGSANSCTDTSNCMQVLISGISKTTANVISVHPNPFNSTTTITFSNNIQQYDVELYDLTGRIIATYKKQSTPTFILQRNNIAAGVYTLKIVSNGDVLATRKLVVE